MTYRGGGRALGDYGEFAALLGDVQASSPCIAAAGLTVGEGQHTRFPCGPDAGEMAQRYSSLDAVPFLLRLTAVQCGKCWYARPSNPLTWIEDEASQALDTAEGAAAGAINFASDSILDVAKSTLGLAVLGIGAFFVVKGLAQRATR